MTPMTLHYNNATGVSQGFVLGTILCISSLKLLKETTITEFGGDRKRKRNLEIMKLFTNERIHIMNYRLETGGLKITVRLKHWKSLLAIEQDNSLLIFLWSIPSLI